MAFIGSFLTMTVVSVQIALKSLPKNILKIRLHVNRISNSSRNSYIYICTCWSGHTQCILLQDSWPERHKELRIHPHMVKVSVCKVPVFIWQMNSAHIVCTYISVGWVRGLNLKHLDRLILVQFSKNQLHADDLMQYCRDQYVLRIS
jgi:hypothetical protein